MRFLVRHFGDTVAVYRVDHDQARAWNPSQRRWLPAAIDWTGIGGGTEYDPATEDEAAQLLLHLGVEADELPAAMLGLNPDESNLAKALRGE